MADNRMGNKATRLFFALLMTVTLSACAANVNYGLQPAPEGVVPVAPLASDLPPYRIQLGDVLQIKMVLNPELEQDVVVRPDGMISTPLAQDIRAYGLTPAELQEKLISLYRKQLTSPQLTVVVRSFAPTRVYVMGEVASPGEYVSVGQAPTLLQAIARAGGVKNSAKQEFITILRRGAGEKPEAMRANYKEATSGNSPLADVRLAAGDIVFVPKSAIAEAYVGYEQFIKQFISTSASVSASYDLN